VGPLPPQAATKMDARRTGAPRRRQRERGGMREYRAEGAGHEAFGHP
jgi:hypothetical protein